MKLRLVDVLNGKPTQIKNKEYFATKDYVQPFIDRMATAGALNITCWVKPCEQVSLTDGEPDAIYNRVLIAAQLPESVGDYHKTICMAYSLDVKKPTVKFYSGWTDSEDRFYMLSEAMIIVKELEESMAIDYSPIETLLKLDDKVINSIQQIKNIEYEYDHLQKILGNWIDSTINKCVVNDSGKVKLPTTMPIDVYKSFIIDKDSDYYIQPNNKVKLSYIWDKYLDIIRDDDKDITNKAEKTVLVGKILGL